MPLRERFRRAPLLIGVAYEIQRVDVLPMLETDRRMDAVVTERALHWIAGGAA